MLAYEKLSGQHERPPPPNPCMFKESNHSLGRGAYCEQWSARVGAAAQELRQQEITYNVDYQLVMMERCLARAGGQRTDDETAALTAHIGELTAALTAAAAEYRLLGAAVKTVALHLSARRSQAQGSQRYMGPNPNP